MKETTPGLLNWPNFLRIAPLFQWPLSPRQHSLSYREFLCSVYFLRVVGSPLHRSSFRCYCIFAGRSEWRRENWKIQQNFVLNLAMPLWASVEEIGLWEWAAKTTRVARGTYEICPYLMWRVKAETGIFYWLVFPWIRRNNFNLLLFA